MTDQEIKDRQLKLLRNIYETWLPPQPAFKSNHEGVPVGCVPHISVSDVHDYKYNIRAIPYRDFESFENTENGEIIAHYESMEDLVADGWELD